MYKPTSSSESRLNSGVAIANQTQNWAGAQRRFPPTCLRLQEPAAPQSNCDSAVEKPLEYTKESIPSNFRGQISLTFWEKFVFPTAYFRRLVCCVAWLRSRLKKSSVSQKKQGLQEVTRKLQNWSAPADWNTVDSFVRWSHNRINCFLCVRLRSKKATKARSKFNSVLVAENACSRESYIRRLSNSFSLLRPQSISTTLPCRFFLCTINPADLPVNFRFVSCFYRKFHLSDDKSLPRFVTKVRKAKRQVKIKEFKDPAKVH